MELADANDKRLAVFVGPVLLGQDPELVEAITAAVKAVVDIPVIPKLTPNTPNIGEIAKAAIAGGADGLCAINGIGSNFGMHHQANQVGGIGTLSGRTAYYNTLVPAIHISAQLIRICVIL